MGRNRQVLLLVALVVILVAVAWVQWRRLGGAPDSAVANPNAGAAAASRPNGSKGPASPAAIPGVRLDRLSAERLDPEPSTRNLFRFRPPPPPPPPPRPAPTSVTNAPDPALPPPPPPIPLKFIGIVSGEPAGKLAVLTDDQDVFYGREGDVIDGRYRILRIGVESVELAYLDGTGRRTIRLSSG